MNQFILENGSHKIRLGYLNINQPYLKYDNAIINTQNESITGPIIENHSNSKFTRPMLKGQIYKWENQIQIWDDILQNYSMLGHNQITYSLNDNLLYFIGNINQTFKEKQKISEFFFEKQNFQKVVFGYDDLNAFFSTGKTTGIVYDCGYQTGRLMSILKGCFDNSLSQQYTFDAQKIEQFLQKYSLKQELQMVRKNLKEIDLNLNELIQQKNDNLAYYLLPDQNKIIQNNAQQYIKQQLKDQQYDFNNFEHNFKKMIGQFSLSVQKDLVQNVLIIGGLSKLKGFKETISQIVSLQQPLSFIELDSQKQLVYQGSYAFSFSELFQNQIITKQLWQEEGQRIFNKKYK